MSANTYTVTLAGPTVRSRPLAEHRDLTHAEADELRQIYLVLGHAAAKLTVEPGGTKGDLLRTVRSKSAAA